MTTLPASKRLGIIDLGSNSVRLMVVNYQPRLWFHITEEFSRRVRLAEGMARANNALQPPAIERALDTLRMFRDFCTANGIRQVHTVGTAAVRDAANQRDFVQRVRAETGLRVRVLSGEEEAYYGTLGVINSLNLQAGVVMDIGGGSAQLSRVNQGRFQHGLTTPLGAVRLTEQHVRGDKVNAREDRALREAVAAQVAPLGWVRLAPGEMFVGLGGTFRTLARMDRDSRAYPLKLLNGYELPRDRLERLADRLRRLSVAERMRQVPGLSADRADVIYAGAVAALETLYHANADRVVIGNQGLRDGVFYETFLASDQPPVLPRLREFSVLNLGRVYGYQSAHADQVARLALRLFDQLQPVHHLDPLHREWLWAAAQLNDIGTVINYQDHHKHSAYILLNAGLPGYTHRELALIASLCIHHRKGKTNLEPFAALLELADASRVRTLGAMLRAAEALDSSRTQAVRDVAVRLKPDKITLEVQARAANDIRWDMGELTDTAEALAEALGREVKVRAVEGI